MNQQLTIYDAVGDKDLVSPTNELGDTKRHAIQRYLDRAKAEPTACVKKYKPNGRKTEYFRLDYRIGKKVKSIHIRGGNISAKLANHRANVLRAMINRGADLDEIIAQTKDFNSKAK